MTLHTEKPVGCGSPHRFTPGHYTSGNRSQSIKLVCKVDLAEKQQNFVQNTIETCIDLMIIMGIALDLMETIIVSTDI